MNNKKNDTKRQSGFKHRNLIITFAVLLALLLGGMIYLAQGDGDVSSDPAIVASGSCGNKATYTVDEQGNLVISGSGATYDYGYGETPWWGMDITTVTVNEGITTLGKNAFRECTNVRQVTLPGSLTKVKAGVFEDFGNNELGNITFPDGKGELELNWGAFDNCTMTSITFKKRTNLNQQCIEKCNRLSEITIEKKFSAYMQCIWNCSNFHTININTTSRDEWVNHFTTFTGCDITRINIGPNNQQFEVYGDVIVEESSGERWAKFCQKDATGVVVIPEGVTKIDQYSFGGCGYITGVVMPNTVTAIELGAFQYCPNLESFIMSDSVTRLGSNIIHESNKIKVLRTSPNITFADAYFFTNKNYIRNGTEYNKYWGNFSGREPLWGYYYEVTDDNGWNCSGKTYGQVLFDLTYGPEYKTYYAAKTIQNGTTIPKLTDPVRDGYTFDGWYKDKGYTEIWDFNTDKVSGNMTLYARWTANGDPNNYEVNSWSGLQKALNNASVNKIVLQSDIRAYGASFLNSTRTVTIDLNGHTIDRQLYSVSDTGYVMKVSSGSLTITDSKGGAVITGGYATNGGGIYVASGATLNYQGGDLYMNRASSNGGGIFVASTATLNFSGGSIRLGYAMNEGGAIQTLGTTTISGGTISDNSAYNTGGAIRVNGGSLTITGGTITGNMAGGDAGGIFVAGTLNLNGGTITGNWAGMQGGGIVISSGSVNAQGSPVVNNNKAGYGYNIVLRSTIKIQVTSPLGANAKLDLTRENVARSGSADNQILAQSVSSGDVSKFSYMGGNLALNGSNLRVSFTNPRPGWVAVYNWDQLEDALEDGDKVVLMADCTANKNSNQYIKVNNKKNVELDLNGFTMNRNRTSKDSDGHTLWLAGSTIMHIHDSVGTGRITGGYANNGGGINIGGDATLYIHGGLITGNNAGDGGGILVKGVLNMDGGSICNNWTSGAGGGIHVWEDSGIVYSLSNVIISHNTCTGNGGGAIRIIDMEDKMTMQNCVIIANISQGDEDGGAISMDSSGRNLTMNSVRIIGNTSGRTGGAIENWNGDMVLNNCYVMYNSTNGQGGAVYNAANFSMSGGMMVGNYAYNNGGAVRAYTGWVGITNVTMVNNVARNNGGAIYINDGGTVDINGCNFTHNSAGSKGGAIYDGGDNNTLRMKGKAIIEGNVAYDGKDVYLCSGKKITINGAMTSGSSVKVNMESGQGVFTSGYNTYNAGKAPSQFFKANFGYLAYLSGNEAAIGKANVTSVDIEIAWSDENPKSAVVRVDLLKNGVKTNEKLIVAGQLKHSFTITSMDSAIYTINATITNSNDYDVSISEVNGVFVVTCTNIVKQTESLIDAIGTVEYNNDCHQRILNARASYEALSAERKTSVSNYAVLTAAETKYAELEADYTAANNVTKLINGIGTVELTIDSKNKIDAARAAYDALNDTRKALVTNYQVLLDAEVMYQNLFDQSLVQAVIDMIDDLPLEPTAEQIKAAKDAYSALPDRLKPYVTNYDKLVSGIAPFGMSDELSIRKKVGDAYETMGWVYGQYDAVADKPYVLNHGAPADHPAHIQPVFVYTEYATGIQVVPSGSLPAGTYYVTAMYAAVNYDDVDYNRFTYSEEFTVSQAEIDVGEVAVSWIGTNKYDGHIKNVSGTVGDLSIGADFSVTVVPQDPEIDDVVVPGTYDVTVTLIDENYVFSTGLTTYATTLTIVKADNSITSLDIEGWTYGDVSNEPVATAIDGTPVFTYSTAEDGPYEADVPTDAGTYYVKASVAASDLYNATEAVTTFVIEKAKLNITADNLTIVEGDTPVYTCTISGWKYGDVWGDYYNGEPGFFCIYSPTSSGPGYYAIMVSIADITLKDPLKDNYILTPVDGSLFVTDIEETIYTVTFDAMGGTVNIQTMTVGKNLPYGDLPTAAREGYIFYGWFKNLEDNNAVTEDMTVTEDHTLYAAWIKEPERETVVEEDGTEVVTEKSTIEITNGVIEQTRITRTTVDGKVTAENQIFAGISGDVNLFTIGKSTESASTGVIAASVETVLTVPQDSALTGAHVTAAKELTDNISFLLGGQNVSKKMDFEIEQRTSLTASKDALVALADNEQSFNVMTGTGVLSYDKDAVKTLSQQSGDVTVSMKQNDKSDLNDAQRATIKNGTFITVSAMCGETYISDLGGKVTMTFEFVQTKSWQKIAVYYIDDNGEKQEVEWSYDADSKQMTVTSTHHSVYAVLPAENPDDTNMGYLMGAFIAAMAVIFCLIVRSKKA